MSWPPTTPVDIVKEALREYVGDGDGADEKVLARFVASIEAKTLRETANHRDLWGPHGEDDESSIQQWLRARAAEIDR